MILSGMGGRIPRARVALRRYSLVTERSAGVTSGPGLRSSRGGAVTGLAAGQQDGGSSAAEVGLEVDLGREDLRERPRGLPLCSCGEDTGKREQPSGCEPPLSLCRKRFPSLSGVPFVLPAARDRCA